MVKEEETVSCFRAGLCGTCTRLKECIKKWRDLIRFGKMFGVTPKEALASFRFPEEKGARALTPAIEWILLEIEREKDVAMKEYVI